MARNILIYCFAVAIATFLSTDALVQSPPRMVKQPTTDELLFRVAKVGSEEDSPFIIECEAEAEPVPKYRWIKNGKHFDWQAYDDRISQQPGRGTLVITSPRDEDLGQYQCFAENEWGIATSNSVFVRKAELNSFKNMDKIIVEAEEGKPFKLTCQPPDGWPKPSVYWFTETASRSIKPINNSRITLDPEGNLWFSNVTREDSSNEFTYTCGVTSLARSEFKLGNRIVLNVKSSGISASQNKHEPIQQYVTRKNEVAYRGGEADLYCIYGGTPLPQIVWRKNGVILHASDRFVQEDYGKRIQIKGLNFEDKGSYTCDVSNGVGSAKSYSINLDILAIPFFTTEPDFQNAAEDEEVELRCEASGVPPPEIKWIHNGKPISEAPPNPRRIVGPNSIIIKNLVKKDTGNYGCNATNSLGYVYKDVFINVLALAPEISEPPQDVTTVNERNVTMMCRVFGAPKPLVKWLKDGVDLTGGRYTTTSTGELQIENVLYHDAGVYTCYAENKLGHAFANATLSVKDRTRITDLPEDYEVEAGSQATFRCNAKTDPSLNLKIEWLHKNQLIDFDDEPRFVQTNDYSLTITKTIELDSGIFTCRAKTELDQDIAQATLIVQDVPNAPELESVQCNSQDAKVTWHSTGDNRAPILRYIIQYNTSFTPDTWDVPFDSIPATDMSYNVFLSPWANYTFRVLAVNKVGPSLPSDHSDVCTTQSNVPFKNPDNVKGEGTEPNNLVISWKPMEEIEHNAPRFQYRVNWKRDIPGEDWTSEDIFDWKQNELRVPDQPTFQPYKIKVVAMNEMGEANVTPVEAVGYSGEDSPLEAPSNFTLVQVTSSTSALLSWNKVSVQSLRGHFKGYKIQIWTDKGGESSMKEILVNWDATKTLVNEFVPYTKNYACVLAYNGRFNGPRSNTLSFETPEGTPGTVQSFEAYQMGTSALYLVWKKPEQPNGILNGYRIFYQIITGTSAGREIERIPPITDPKQTHAKLANLEPNTKYRLKISATTRAGDGEVYFIEQRTKSGIPLEPERPSFTVVTVPSSEVSLANVRVTWLPSYDGRSGSHFYVQYRIKGEPSYKSTDPELNEDSITIRGLELGRVYQIVVVAVDGEYQKQSLPKDIDTSGIEGPIIRPQDNVATAGWFIGMMLAIAFLLLVLILVCVIKRNRGGKYDVHDRELANGRRDYPEEGGFHEYSQPLDNKSRHSMSSGLKPGPESDTDSMAEYGEGETAGMNEDGSFIGQYGRKRRAPPGSTQQPDSASQAFATLV